MTLWFSASAVLPSLMVEYTLSTAHASLFTSAVQAGFVVGTLISAYFGLADRLNPRYFMMAATVVAALVNSLILLLDPTSISVILCRFITGTCMAGIYPIGMRLATTWAKGDLGLLVGLLVGALTLGSASPHLFNAIGGIDWRFTIASASLVSLSAAALMTWIEIGPGYKKAPIFKPKDALLAFTSKPLRLANFGYLGHMWELYAMWAWLGVFLSSSFALTLPIDSSEYWARIVTFGTIGMGGAAGCLIGGLVSDRFGRTTLTIIAMAVSGLCAIGIGFLYGGNIYLVSLVCMIWGISVIADSAQFSASIAELAPPERIGTLLTVQTSVGFLLTLGTIHLMPIVVDLVTWRYAFVILGGVLNHLSQITVAASCSMDR